MSTARPALPRELTSSLIIRRISPEETIELRHLVLWPQKKLDEQLFPYDYYPDTIHFGAFLPSLSQSPSPSSPMISEVEGPIAVLTLVFPQIQAQNTTNPVGVQLRKFAVNPSYQGNGIGTFLFNHVISFLKSARPPSGDESGKSTTQLYLDARSHQVGFYERLGMTVIGDPFEKYADGASASAMYVRMGRSL